jgi:hypothetical protein
MHRDEKIKQKYCTGAGMGKSKTLGYNNQFSGQD